MRLVLQCTLCGTIQTVGCNHCGTCRASGVLNLRLMFECLSCFGLGIDPTCGACSPRQTMTSEGVAADLAERWGVSPVAPPPAGDSTTFIMAEEMAEDEFEVLIPAEDDPDAMDPEDDVLELPEDEVLLAEFDESENPLSLDVEGDSSPRIETPRGERADD